MLFVVISNSSINSPADLTRAYLPHITARIPAEVGLRGEQKNWI
jgi:hypothetical protein